MTAGRQLRIFGSAQRADDAVPVAGAEIVVRFGDFGPQFIRVAFRKTAYDEQPLDAARFLGFRGAEYHVDGFLFGVADESAGVDYHRLGVRSVAVPEYFVARRRQPRHQMFAVDRVLGAAKSDNINLFHGRTER